MGIVSGQKKIICFKKQIFCFSLLNFYRKMGEVERECLWGKVSLNRVWVQRAAKETTWGIARPQEDGWEKGVTKANDRANDFVSRNKIFVS